MPRDTQTPLHLILLLDLADPSCPFRSDGAVRKLPLYYPLKFGEGGPSVQYAVKSDDEIEILYLSDPVPDPENRQYVQVAELPSSPAQILPLSYEEARIVSFAGGYFQPNRADWAILHELTREHDLIQVGGHRRLPLNAADVFCKNPRCQFFECRIWLDVIASVPPISVRGSNEFWHDYQGDVELWFGLCSACQTVIAFNVAS